MIFPSELTYTSPWKPCPDCWVYPPNVAIDGRNPAGNVHKSLSETPTEETRVTWSRATP